jgi:hypothetical protein
VIQDHFSLTDISTYIAHSIQEGRNVIQVRPSHPIRVADSIRVTRNINSSYTGISKLDSATAAI